MDFYLFIKEFKCVHKPDFKSESNTRNNKPWLVTESHNDIMDRYQKGHYTQM